MTPCLLLSLLSCTATPPAEIEAAVPSPAPAAPVTDPAATDAFSKASERFGLDLWNALRSQPGNLVLSPASVSLALAMTASGARGETAEQMLKVLHLDPSAMEGVHAAIEAQLSSWNQPGADYQLSVANRLFGEQTLSFEQPFLELTGQRFGAALEPLDFKGAAEPARERINGWVSEQTRARIPSLLPSGSLDSDTRLVLVNALYFQGDWQHAFEASKTRPAAFQTATGEAQVPTMHQTASFPYAKLDDVQVLELPYAGGHLVMDIVLPRQADGLSAVEDLSVEDTGRWLSALQPTEVEVALPKLELEMDAPVQLKPALSSLGMPLAFSPQADFSGIARLTDPFYIDEAYHQTSLTLDEEGTEAAAATAVVMTTKGMATEAPEPERFVADRPFLFLLRDVRSGAVLFLGRVADPR